MILEDRPACLGPCFDTEAVCVEFLGFRFRFLQVCVECLGRPDGSVLCHLCQLPLCRGHLFDMVRFIMIWFGIVIIVWCSDCVECLGRPDGSILCHLFAGVFDLLGFMLCGLVWYGSHPLWFWYGMVHDGMVWYSKYSVVW